MSLTNSIGIRVNCSVKYGNYFSTLSMVLLFIGPSGSGKDTQADILKEERDFDTVSSGELLREISSGETRMQRIIKDQMNKGFLPDRIVYGLLEMYFAGTDWERLIMTGVIRRHSQIEMLDNALINYGHKLTKAVYFQLSDEIAVKRLGGRRVCEPCSLNYHLDFGPPKAEGKCDKCSGPLIQREDDTPDGIKARLSAFHQESEPILRTYKERGQLLTIDADHGISEIQEELVSQLGLV